MFTKKHYIKIIDILAKNEAINTQGARSEAYNSILNDLCYMFASDNDLFNEAKFRSYYKKQYLHAIQL